MKKLVLKLALCALIISCNSKNNSKANTDGLVKEAEKSMKELTVSAEKYANKLDELLTLEMAAEAAGLPAAKAKKKPDTEIEKKYNKFSISYSWDNNAKVRTIEVMKQKITTPINDEVELSWVKNISLDAFKKENKAPDAAQKAEATKAMDEKVTELTKENNIDEKSKKTATEMAVKAMENYSAEEVAGVGDYALFANNKIAGVPIRELKVFYSGIAFTLRVDVSNDSKVNDEKAIALAKKIISEKLK
jgi:hypothetical protein